MSPYGNRFMYQKVRLPVFLSLAGYTNDRGVAHGYLRGVFRVVPLLDRSRGARERIVQVWNA